MIVEDALMDAQRDLGEAFPGYRFGIQFVTERFPEPNTFFINVYGASGSADADAITLATIASLKEHLGDWVTDGSVGPSCFNVHIAPKGAL